MVDVLVVGGGPAGRAIAAATARRGLHTVLLDPAPDAPWRATYGSWADELPPDVPVAARAAGRAFALTEHHLGWEYAVLDVPALRAHLATELHRAGAQVRSGRAAAGPTRGELYLTTGERLTARVIINAAGAPRSRSKPSEQTAAGLVVGASAAASLVGPGEALFMDWRPE
ncbi:MAG: lycopene cyclase family protein, partial [Pseudonocardia sp.]